MGDIREMKKMRSKVIVVFIMFCVINRVSASENILDPFEVIKEARRLSSGPLWPGYDPSVIPAALYDGEKTYLFNHPQPPEDFKKLDRAENVWVYEGRYPVIVGHSMFDIGGVMTAGVLLDLLKGSSITETAAVLLHEKFHVFQMKNHPNWMPNAVDQFIYPFEDVDHYALVRLEVEALRHALLSKTSQDKTCWASVAAELREMRFEKLEDKFVAYERGNELLEGLAMNIEYSAAGKNPVDSFPKEGFSPEDMRMRTYFTGLAMASLLSLFHPGWEHDIETGKYDCLDQLFKEKFSDREDRCGFSDEDKKSAFEEAEAAVKNFLKKKSDMKKEFFSQEGFTIVIISEKMPLQPAGFDPMNVTSLSKEEILHHRFLRLKNSSGSLEVMNRKSLSEGCGEHPLFNGVCKLTVAGFSSKPSVFESEGKVVIKSEGFTAEFENAKFETAGAVLTVTLTEQK